MKENKKWNLLFLGGVVATIVILVLNYVLLKDYSPNDRSSIGDMFGVSAALFTGLAFVGLIYTIILQRQDLQLQMEELKATRDELAGQKEQMQAQVKSIKIQNFENTFFQLVRLYNDNVEATMIQNSRFETLAQGKDCFASYFRSLRNEYQSKLINHSHLPQSELIEICVESLYESRESKMAHHFRTLYSILKFIDQSDVGNKKDYTNLLRSQLSSYEQLLLFYNCLSSRGSAKFKPLIERYSLLKHVPQETLLHPSHVSLYAPEVFGGNPKQE